MKILVTGGAGYIGSHVVLEGLSQGHDIVILDDLSSGSKNNLSNETKFYEGSTLSDENLSNVFRENKFDAVIHLAASKSAGESMLNPGKYAQNNIIGGINLINHASKNGVKIFIFSSSAAVYGYPNYSPIDEKHLLKPESYYGYTKLALEENLKWFAYLKGMNYCALRYFNAAGYGVNNKSLEVEKNPQNLIPRVMETIFGKRDKLSIFGSDYNTKDGTGVRDYVHVSDLASAHLQSLFLINRDKKSVILNLGTGLGHSVLDVIKMAEKVSNHKINYELKPRREGDCDIVLADSSKAIDLLSWSPIYSDLRTIIESTFRNYKLKETF
ncbi:UDP-glucose 4-epimerase GalE [Candidatus Marinimicrobia bacterium]|nr:UDP-glucose 4-epimerase GalE [Candidatus Neomarinimicrobiota bacterium]